MGLMRMIFVVRVSRFEEMKIIYKILFWMSEGRI